MMPANLTTPWPDMPIDLTTLIAPVSDASPCGDDMLFSSEFDAIQHARRFDDPSLDQGEWVTEIKEADWSFVVERSVALIATQTKDLRLAAWLTEALALEEGLKGLTQGYALLSALSEHYWEHLHPLPDGDDAEYRLGNIAWLASRTAELLRAVPLTQTSGMVYSALDWEVATHVAQAVKRDPDHADDIARGKPSIDQIEAAKRSTPPAFYTALLADLKAFQAAMNALEQELDRRAADSAPSFRQTKSAYESVYLLAERFAREVGVVPEAAAKPALAERADGAAHVERAEPAFKTEPHRASRHDDAPTDSRRHSQPLGRHCAIARGGEVPASYRTAQSRRVSRGQSRRMGHYAFASMARHGREGRWLAVAYSRDIGREARRE
jgi:type VI secretion system protein ImpA